MSITRGEIAAAVRAGDDTIPVLKRKVGCCTGCGTCEERVKKVIEDTKAATTQTTVDDSANPKKESA